MSLNIVAVNRAEIPSLQAPDRFLTEVTYFMSLPDDDGVPELGKDEYWIDLTRAREWLESFVVEIVSPLDAEAKAEIELSEFHEIWLEWMVKHEVSHIRLEKQ